MKGVIAAGSRLTAQAGAEMLRRGGNAVDGAVAATFVSFIAEIGFVHLGGSGIAMVHDPHRGDPVVYDFFSSAPGLGGTRKPEELDFREVSIDYGDAKQAFHLGRGSVAVPGNVFGLCAMAEDWGRLPLGELLQPALNLAKNGMTMDALQSDVCRLLTPLYTDTPGIRSIFAPNGQMIRAGEKLFIPHLAETLSDLARQGVGYLRTGRLAKTILCDQLANGGALTEADLAVYQVQRLTPIRVPYRGYQVLLPPPCSTGGALTAFSLKVLSAFDVGRLNHGAAEHLRLLTETMAATSRARVHWDAWIDAEPASDAIDKLLDDEFVGEAAEEVQRAMRQKKPSSAKREPKAPRSTSHLSVIDQAGMAVSVTTTAGESAGYVVPWTGFIPNNIMGEADLHPHGFFSRSAGQRISTMITPLLILQDGETRMAIGTGGSNRIRSATLQVVSNLIDFKMSLSSTVNQARIHYEDGVLQCEAGFDKRAVDRLEKDGYQVNRWQDPSLYFGGAHSVMRSPLGRLSGAGDPRRGGAMEVV